MGTDSGASEFTSTYYKEVRVVGGWAGGVRGFSIVMVIDSIVGSSDMFNRIASRWVVAATPRNSGVIFR